MTDRESIDRVIQGTQIITKTEKRFTGIAKKNDTTPSVKDLAILHTANAVATTITNLRQGLDTQTLSIIPNDPGIAQGANSNTTLSNNGNITTSTGANKLLVQGRKYNLTFSKITNRWHEDG